MTSTIQATVAAPVEHLTAYLEAMKRVMDMQHKLPHACRGRVFVTRFFSPIEEAHVQCYSYDTFACCSRSVASAMPKIKGKSNVFMWVVFLAFAMPIFRGQVACNLCAHM